MAYDFTVGGRISKPVHEVFEAVVDPKKLSGYFTTGGAQGRLETGSTVTWDFHDFPGAFPVHVVEVERDKKIVLRWGAAPDDDPAGAYETTVTMTFEGLEDGRTLVRITESGWRDNAAAQKASYGNCEGWTGMLCAMKVYVEHGINLRDGFYK
ncbi:MAG: SRPBCC family protein [Devosia sp.]